MWPLSYIFAAVMPGNGLLHIVCSLLEFTLLPGIFSSPVLLAAAAYLLVAVQRGAVQPGSRTDLRKKPRRSLTSTLKL